MVRDRPDVQDVLMAITDADTGADSWPFSDRVYIITRAQISEVKNWVQPLSPEDVIELPNDQSASEHLPAILSGHKPCLVWWD